MNSESMLSRINMTVSLISFAGLIGLAIYVFTIPQKLAYVNTAKLVNEFKGMQDARVAYQQKASIWKSNIDTLSNEVRSQILSFDKDSQGLTQKEKELSQELIRAKQRQLAEYQQAMNSQAQQEDGKMTEQVLSEINAYLKRYGESHNLKIVIAATEYGNIAYADEGLDITDDILEGLNSEYKKR